MSRRVEKVARELQRALSLIIPYEMTDPRIKHVTITRVEPSPDLKTAKVFFSVLGEERDQRRVIWGLIHAKRFIQTQLGAKVKLRFLPDLVFVYDESIAGSIRIVKLVESLVKKDEPTAGEEDGEDDGAEEGTGAKDGDADAPPPDAPTPGTPQP